MKEEEPATKDELELGIPVKTIVIILVFLGALLVFGFLKFAEAKEFFHLILTIDPQWLFIATILQVFTYLVAASVWWVVTHESHALPLKDLTKISVEQLTIDQIIPTGGIAGNTLVMRSLHEMGVSKALATEVMMIDILAYHIAYSSMTLVTVLILWLRHGVTPLVSGIVSGYFLISVFVVSLILLILFNKIPREKLPKWLKKQTIVNIILDTTDKLSPERVLSPSLLTKTSLLRVVIFLLDILSFGAILEALHQPTSLGVVFAAFIMASIAGTVSLLPGGLGGFEVVAVATLIFFKVTPEAALSSTLILRGLTLWLPLIPGLYFAKRHFKRVKQS